MAFLGLTRRSRRLTAPQGAVPRALRVATGCRSVEDFIASFAPFIDGKSMLLAAAERMPIGAERSFVFQLADGTAVMQGRGRIEAHGGHDLPGGRTGLKLAFLELAPPSRHVHRALLAAQKTPARRSHRNTVSRGSRPPVSRPSPSPGKRRSSWEEEPTVPVDPGHLVALSAWAEPRPDEHADLDDDDVETDVRANLSTGSHDHYSVHDDSGTHLPQREEQGEPAGEAEGSGAGYWGSFPPEPAAIGSGPKTWSAGALAIGTEEHVMEVPSSVPAPPATPRPVTMVINAVQRRWPGILIAVAVTAGIGVVRGHLSWEGPLAVGSATGGAAGSAATATLVRPEPAAVGDGLGCRARVVTVPDGVTVRWGTQIIGTTPLDEQVPCGEAHVVLVRPRYQRVDRTVVAGAETVVDVKMERLRGKRRR